MAERFDVLIIGGGLAGACAAAAASEDGSRVLLLEKRTMLGGSSVLSAGLNAYAGTDEQRTAGIDDDVDLLRKDLLETGRHRNDADLVDTYCREQLDTYRWLRAHGAEFGAPRAASGQSVPRSHPLDVAAVIESLVRTARGRGTEVRYQARAVRLIARDERVVGVWVEQRGVSTDIAAGSVIITSGGFSRSTKLLAQFAPAMEKALKAGGEGSTGDGLELGLAVGAKLLDVPYVKGTFGIFPWSSPAEGGHGILPVYKGAVAVNGHGRRFTDESRPYKDLGDSCLAQPEGIAFQIFDDSVLALTDAEVAIYDFAPRVQAGQVRPADTLAELADDLGLPADDLEATVADYNRSIENGQPDRFGRRTLSGGVGTPRPIVGPPYYGYPCTTVVLATYCGLAIDATAQVRNVFDEPIAGLYAAGEVTGGFHGAGYVTGTSLGKSAIFGRIAGQSAAAFATGPEATQ